MRLTPTGCCRLPAVLLSRARSVRAPFQNIAGASRTNDILYLIYLGLRLQMIALTNREILVSLVVSTLGRTASLEVLSKVWQV